MQNHVTDMLRVKTMNRNDLSNKRVKKIDDKITLVLTYHSTLAKATQTTFKSQCLIAVLPSPPRLAFLDLLALRV